MYIPYQTLQAIHQDQVNDCLRRSEQRRMLQALKQQTNTELAARSSGTTLRARLGSMLGMAARP